MANGAFPRDQHLTSIAVAYKNPDIEYIADKVLPRVPVGKITFKYWEYPLEQNFQIPNTRVGEKSRVPQIELEGSEVVGTVIDHGIEIPLTYSDVSEAPKGVDPRERAAERAADIVLLDRERRVANLVFNAASYGAGLTLDCAAAPWSSDTSEPLKTMRTKFDSCPMRPNVAIFGQAVWTQFSMHPKVVSAALGNDGQSGVATRQRVAELLEVNEVLVGRSLANTVKPGKGASLARLWGNFAAGIFRDQNVDTSGGITFGLTAQLGSRVAGSKEIDIGLRGGTAVRVGESVKELIVANRAGFLFTNCVA